MEDELGREERVIVSWTGSELEKQSRIFAIRNRPLIFPYCELDCTLKIRFLARLLVLLFRHEDPIKDRSSL